MATAGKSTCSAAGVLVAPADISVTSADVTATAANVTVAGISAAVADRTVAIVATAVAVAAVNRVVAAVVVVVARAVPWAGADEEAAYEPVGTVVAIGRAAVRSIAVVAIGAYGRRSRVVRILSRVDRSLSPVVRILSRIGWSRIRWIGRDADSNTHRNLRV
jgi:prophage DNA circulation protein